MRYGETYLASGTGFLVQTHTCVGLVTARHNLTGRDHETNDCLHTQGGVPDNIEVHHNGLVPSSNVLRSEPIIDGDGQALWIEHPHLGPHCDVVLLPLLNPGGVLLAPYTWQREYADIAVQVAEPVSVVGFPMAQSAGAMLAIWCTGYIASEPTQDYGGQPKFLIDCRTRKGQSGSPVIAYRNGPFNSQAGGLTIASGSSLRPLGVYTGRIHPEADIGVVWKWSIVEELMIALDLHISRSIQNSMIKFGRDSREFAAELAKFNHTVTGNQEVGSL